MFYKVLIAFLLLDALVLLVAVLLQSGKGGGLAASFGGASGGDQLFGAHQAGNLLTKLTWWTAGIFMGLAFFMQIISARPAGPTSVLDQTFAPAPTKAAPPSNAPATQAPASPLQNLPPAAPPAGAGKQPDAATKQPDPAKKQP